MLGKKKNNVPPLMLVECDAGMGGPYDAKFKTIAYFTSAEIAQEWLRKRGFDHKEYGTYYHREPERRHCMGQISYQIKENDGTCYPVDPE